MPMKLIANRRMRYGTRRLQPGEAFEANDRDARLLLRIKRASEAPRPPVEIPPIPKTLVEKLSTPAVPTPTTPVAPPGGRPWESPPMPPVAPPTVHSLPGETISGAAQPDTVVAPDLQLARADYLAAKGKKPDSRWGVNRIRAELAGGV